MADEQVLTALSQHDAALAAQQPTGVPEGWEDHVFETPDLPTNSAFTLRNLQTMEEFGPFNPGDFVLDPTTGIATAHTDGHPLMLRARRQWTEKLPGSQQSVRAFEQVNDDGGSFSVLVINPLWDNTLEIEEPDFT